MAERKYPVKSSETAARMQQVYTAKIERNRLAGRSAMETAQFKPFEGHSREALARTFEVTLELDSLSREEIQTKVIQPLEEIAHKHGITLAVSGRGDVPSHITLEVGVFKDMPEEQAAQVDEWLLSNRSHMQWLMKILKGLRFHFDTIVIGPTSYICASQFDDEQGAPFRMRQAIDTMIERSGVQVAKNHGAPLAGMLEPRKYDDILHSTIARLTNRVAPEQLVAFVEEAEQVIGGSLKSHPLEVTVGEVSVGRSLKRVERLNPELII